MELCPLKFSLAACALCSGKPLECAVPSLHLQSIPGCGCRHQLSQSSCPFHCPASHFPARTAIPWRRLLLPGAAAVWALAGVTLTVHRVLLSVTAALDVWVVFVNNSNSWCPGQRQERGQGLSGCVSDTPVCWAGISVSCGLTKAAAF